MTAAGHRVEEPAPLFDTHCHLVLLEDQGLLQSALEGAAVAGIEQILSVGLNLEDSRRNQAIAHAHPGVVFSVGWHPHEKAPPDAVELAALDQLLDDPRAVAVGEIGLDRFFRPGYHEVSLDVQLRSLHAMLELAAAHRKPVLIHDRDAHDDVLAVLRTAPDVRGIMHCFTGDSTHAQRCVDAGFAISFSGIVTFASAGAIRAAATQCPAGAFVVETDAPFLAPVPHRGTVNLPERVADTAAAIAALRGVPAAALRADTTSTARRVLGLDASHGRLR